MNTVNPNKDFFGRNIFAGDILAYPGRHGSSLFVNQGIVVAEVPIQIKRIVTDQTTGEVTLGPARKLEHTERAIVVNVSYHNQAARRAAGFDALE